MKKLLKKLVEYKQWIIRIVMRSYFKKANRRLETQAFEDRMKWYLIACRMSQDEAIDALKEVKRWIKDNYS